MTFLLLLMGLQQALAQSQQFRSETPGLRSSQALKVNYKDNLILATLEKGFHFNEKAPNSLKLGEVKILPSSIQAQNLQFDQLTPKIDQASLSLYVCDDAITYCETHRYSLSSSSPPSKKPSPIKKRQDQVQMNKHGFIEKNFQQALDLAKSKGQLLLVDFGARWCPGCVRLENEIFDQKFFKLATKNYVKVKVDTDLYENVVLSEKFKIYGIPTLMVMNSEQKEISRIVDYQPESVLNSFFEDIKAYPEPIELLKKTSHIDSGQKLLLGRRLLNSTQYAEATEVLKELKPVPTEYLQALIERDRKLFESSPSYKETFEKSLRLAIAGESTSSRSISWRKDLVELLTNSKEKEKITAEGVALADQLLSDPELLKKAVVGDLVGEFTGFEAFWIAIMRAELIDSGRGEDAAQKAWAEASLTAEKLNVNAKQKGPGLRYLLITIMAKDFEKAEKFSKEMLTIDPSNWDVARRRVRVLVELKKYDEAILLGQKVIKNSYDRNQFWVAEFLAKAYFLSAQNQKATQLIDSYLSLPEASLAHMSGSRKKLEALRAQIVEVKPAAAEAR